MSIHIPSPTPARAGMATDQPIRPSIPRPSQTLRALLRRARSLRFSCVPTSLQNSVLVSARCSRCSLSTLHLQKSPDKIALHFDNEVAEAAFAFIEVQKFMFNRSSKFPQILPANGIADGDNHL